MVREKKDPSLNFQEQLPLESFEVIKFLQKEPATAAVKFVRL